MPRPLQLFAVIFILATKTIVGQPPTAEKMTLAREHFNNGIKYGIANDFEGAVKEFVTAIDFNPLYAEAFLYKGLAEIELKNYDQAVKDFTITIELDPAFSDQAHYFRGLARYFQDNLAEAIDDFTVAIRMNPDFVAFYQRGKANLKLGEYRRSLQDFDIALRLNEEFYEANLYRGINYYYLNMYDEALADLDIALKNMPNNAEADHYVYLITNNLRDRNHTDSTPAYALATPEPSSQDVAAHAMADFTPVTQTTAAPVVSPVDGQPSATQVSQAQQATPTYLFDDNQQDKQEVPSSTDVDFSELFKASRNAQQQDSAQQVSQQQASTGEVNDVAVENNPTISNNVEGAGIPVIPDINQLETGLFNKNHQKIQLRGFGIQVASYSNTSNLTSLTMAYAEKYSLPVFTYISNVNGKKLYKIIIGQFATRAEAEALRENLRSGDFPDSFMVILDNFSN